MTEGVKRTVRLGSMVYIGPDGRRRRADCGDEVLIDPKHVERFDKLNVLQVDQAVEAVEEAEQPKRRGGRPRKAED